MNTSTALPLDDPEWTRLSHAYGAAADIPKLLRLLQEFPPSDHYKDEPWYTLWSSLCHQGDVYSASFAAVPHIVATAAVHPERATYNYFLLPTCIEIARVKNGVMIPDHLKAAYFHALWLVPSVVARAANQEWKEDFCSCALAAVAASRGHPTVAEIILELEGDAVPAVLSFLQNR